MPSTSAGLCNSACSLLAWCPQDATSLPPLRFILPELHRHRRSSSLRPFTLSCPFVFWHLLLLSVCAFYFLLYPFFILPILLCLDSLSLTVFLSATATGSFVRHPYDQQSIASCTRIETNECDQKIITLQLSSKQNSAFESTLSSLQH